LNIAHYRSIFLFVLLFSIIYVSCGEKKHHAARVVTKYTPNEKGEDISVTYTDSGYLRAKLFSPLVEHFKNQKPYMEMKKGMTIYFYNISDAIKPSSMLKADYAIKYENEQKIIVKNDVVAVNSNNDTLNTELLIWDEFNKKIYSNKAVRIKKKDEILWGNGFESNEDFSEYKIFHLKGTLKRNVETK
jgi:LPS export ABC transporter protein LptC